MTENDKKQNKKSILLMAECAMFSAIICVISPWIVPVGTIPISFGLFAVLFISSITSCKQSVISVIVYILIGAVGIPVFAGPSGGFYRLLGLTGGYIFGYIACAFITSALINRYKNRLWIFLIAMILGTISCYLFGVLWYMFISKNTLYQSILIGIIPFLPVDIIKILFASFLGYTIRPKMKKIKGI